LAERGSGGREIFHGVIFGVECECKAVVKMIVRCC
jgi:hypothetical protein